MMVKLDPYVAIRYISSSISNQLFLILSLWSLNSGTEDCLSLRKVNSPQKIYFNSEIRALGFCLVDELISNNARSSLEDWLQSAVNDLIGLMKLGFFHFWIFVVSYFDSPLVILDQTERQKIEIYNYIYINKHPFYISRII